MQDDPVRYWQDLTSNYRRMSDGEILELAEKPEDLTEVAQQVLRDEMSRRGLDKPKPSYGVERPGKVSSVGYHHMVDGSFGNRYIPSGPEDPDDDASEDETAHEYTWKTLLCDCESNDQAWQLREALKRHGIEGWVRAVSAYSIDVLGPQLYVAADELEQARIVAAQPIPQDIIDDWNMVVPEFEAPNCPSCGSKDEITLEGTDPVNSWFCEACGAEWTDAEETSEGFTSPAQPS